MPGPDLAYAPTGPDLFPKSEEEHAALLAWANQAFNAARSAKQTREDKWRKYHRVYRSYIERTNSWRSAVFVPYTFSAIESIVPKMVAQLPTFQCAPVGPEDVVPAKLMEEELQRDAEQTDLYVELIKAIKTSLKYGTGILKTYYKQDIRRAYEQVPLMEPVTTPGMEMPQQAPDGSNVMGMDGKPMMTTGEPTVTEQPVIGPDGQPVMTQQPYEYVVYAGPAATWVDPFHFWVAPEATTIDDARYVIERFYRDVAYVKKRIEQGIYQLPPGKSTVEECFPEDEDIREQETGLDRKSAPDTTRRAVELLEIHTDDNRVITVLNQTAIIRVSENPYWHGEKPYAIFPDYVQEGEFWAIGEVEAIEGLQDLVNSLYNQRIDNTRLTMDAMFAVNTRAIADERDLVMRPGGVIRVEGDYLPQEAIQRIELGDVTGNAFAEAEQLEQLIERVSGVSAYQLGTDSTGTNRTATGVSLITEAGNTKFALKVRLMELIGLQRLARQWGALVQQYLDEERVVRVLGPDGQWLFPSMTPESIQGALDYNIDMASSTQTEMAKKDQATMLFQTLAPALPQAIPKLAQDLLEAFGKKDLTPYLMGSPDLLMLSQMIRAQQSGGVILPFPDQAQQQQGGQADQTQAQPQQGGGMMGGGMA